MTKKVAIITGAGSGIGAEAAKLLAKKGWRVILAGRRLACLNEVAEEIKNTAGDAVVKVCDVTKADEVRALIATAGARLDVLIHSAGIGHCLTIDELDEKEWRDTLDVAVTGAFLTAKYALPLMRSSEGGCGYIVQVGSLASGGTWEREVGYGTAKGAQVKFSLHLDSQLKKEYAEGGRKIHVHAICPGTVDTPFWDRIPQREADPKLTLCAAEVAWLIGEVIEQPDASIEELNAIKPRDEIVIELHAPFERWSNVIAIKHQSHP